MKQRCVKIDPWTKEITEVHVEYAYIQDEMVHPLGRKEFEIAVNEVLENGDILISGITFGPCFEMCNQKIGGIAMVIAEGGAKSLLVEIQDAVKWL